MSLDALCTNACCAWAGWCKRFTYRNSKHYIPGILPEKMFLCENKEYYIKNKATEIYERDNNVGRDDQPKRAKHPHNNRESGLWEDNEIDTRVEEHIRFEESGPEPDSVLQLQRSSDRRSSEQSSGITPPYRFTINKTRKDKNIFNELGRPELEAYANEMYANLQRRLNLWQEERRKAADALLQDAALNGFSLTWSKCRLSDEPVRSEEVLEDGPTTDVGPDNAE